MNPKSLDDAVAPLCLLQVRYARVYLRETTLISPFPVLLFGGDIEVQHRERLLSVDGWIYFQVCRADAFRYSSHENIPTPVSSRFILKFSLKFAELLPVWFTVENFLLS